MLKLPPRVSRQHKREEPRECPQHRAWVRQHHCSVPNCTRLPIECAHVRVGTDGGMALKPSDKWVVSLCAGHHAEQHRMGEASFSKRYGINLFDLATEFARRSPHLHRLS